LLVELVETTASLVELVETTRPVLPAPRCQTGHRDLSGSPRRPTCLPNRAL
jgi:hypothetical protein